MAILNDQDHRKLVAGVDIGGSHITAAIIDTGSRKILPQTLFRSTVDSSLDAPEILNQWLSLIRKSFSSAPDIPSAMGIAMPGPFDYEAGISLICEQDKFHSLYGLNIKQWLCRELSFGEDQVIFSNDAACFLQGELYSGATQPGYPVLGLTFGTGLGSSIYSEGVTRDADLWHQPFKTGIAEDFLSARWIMKRYTFLSGKEAESVKALAEQAENGHDPIARQVFLEFGKNIAEFVLPLTRQHRIKRVILGGNIAKAWPLFSSGLIPEIEQSGCIIEPAALGEHAALIGSVSFCLQHPVSL